MDAPELFDLHGRVAIVTGGGRGIGRFIAEGLAEAGARVFVASRKLEACEAAAAAIRKAGGEASAVEADISQPESIAALVDHVMAEAGAIDILVNNAARTWAAPFFEYPLEGWDKVFALNVRGVFLLTQAVAEHMKQAGGGAILNISSLSARLGASDAEQPVAAYMASKGAIDAMTRDLAIKLAPHGIRVNAIAPGPFDTDMLAHIKQDPETLAHHDAQVPLGRPGGPDDIKGVAVFLASSAAAFVTGAILEVDGGVSSVYPVRKLKP
ncbi:MAG: glucose 1-dehydrogenase [Deltaproteobacteria bacterium]|nr:glucose 1-dehydrogenase [Deltaproteobacteria bacterium]